MRLARHAVTAQDIDNLKAVHRLVGSGRATEAVAAIEFALTEASSAASYTFLLAGLAVALQATDRHEEALSALFDRLGRHERASTQAAEWIGIASHLDRAGAAAQEIASAYRMAADVAPARSWAVHEANISLGSIALQTGNGAEAARLLAQAMRVRRSDLQFPNLKLAEALAHSRTQLAAVTHFLDWVCRGVASGLWVPQFETEQLRELFSLLGRRGRAIR